MKEILFVVAMIACVALSLCDGMEEKDTSSNLAFIMAKPAENRSVYEKWQHIDSLVRKISNSATNTLLPILMHNFGHLHLSKECVQNVIRIVLGLKKMRPWAMRFLDSSGKNLDGILSLTTSSLGVYDECMETEVKSERRSDKGKLLFRGQYCIINVVPPLPGKNKFFKLEDVQSQLKNISDQHTIVGEFAKHSAVFNFLSLKFGICVPTGCRVEDVNKVVKHAGDMVSLTASASRCDVKGKKEYTPAIIAAICILSFLLFLVFFGTAIDLYKYYTKAVIENIMIRTILAFSFFTNFQKLINTETSSGTLCCINGIRFLSLTWIILGHSYLSLHPQIMMNVKKVYENLRKDFAIQPVINGTLSVDTFFCMGGLLVCYLTMKLVREEGRKLNIVFFIFHRLWRIYPAYFLAMIFFALINLFGDGPLWHETVDKYQKACLNNWWTNFLFINNFYNIKNSCLPHAWYLAVDFQLYLASLLFLIPMIRRPKVGILLTIIAIVACIFYSGITTYVKDYPPIMLVTDINPKHRKDYLHYFYCKPFAHLGAYCVGILAGYVLATFPKLKIPVVIQIIGWCSAIVINMSVLYGVHSWNSGVEPTLLSTIMYASLSRTAWSLGIAWMIVCCATGHGGVINYILSWKIFIPLSRLSYIAYLIHMIVILLYVGRVKTHFSPDHMHAVYAFFGHLAISYFGAFVGSMIIESPCMAIEKIFLPGHQKISKNISVIKEINSINGTLGTNKNGDIPMISNTDEEKATVDKIVHKL